MRLWGLMRAVWIWGLVGVNEGCVDVGVSEGGVDMGFSGGCVDRGNVRILTDQIGELVKEKLYSSMPSYSIFIRSS